MGNIDPGNRNFAVFHIFDILEIFDNFFDILDISESEKSDFCGWIFPNPTFPVLSIFAIFPDLRNRSTSQDPDALDMFGAVEPEGFQISRLFGRSN